MLKTTTTSDLKALMSRLVPKPQPTILPLKELAALSVEEQNQYKSRHEVFESAQYRLINFAYVKLLTNAAYPAHLTTFSGHLLGIVLELGRQYVNTGFGGSQAVRQSVSALCVDGLLYTGTYYTSSGDYARLKTVEQYGSRWAKLVAKLDADKLSEHITKLTTAEFVDAPNPHYNAAVDVHNVTGETTS